MRWCQEGNWMEDLSGLRDRIRRVDSSVLELVAQRMSLCEEVGAIKSAAGLPIYDPAQEEKVLKSRTQKAHEVGLDENFTRELMMLVMTYSKQLQHLKAVETTPKRPLIATGTGVGQ